MLTAISMVLKPTALSAKISNTQARFKKTAQSLTHWKLPDIHQGGNFKYDWYNQVNADYLRVYLPKGSELISASGQTKEEVKPSIDYEAAGFKKDQEVLTSEQTMRQDPISGTQIFEEGDKTVFGNWVYVSPGQSVTLRYQYRLPFRLDMSKQDLPFEILAQKQSGSLGSGLEEEIKFPESWLLESGSPNNLEIQPGQAGLKTDLSIDKTFQLMLKRANE